MTTTTVLPCSSYLTAQAAYLNAQFDQGDEDEAQTYETDFSEIPVDVWDWLVKFGQSPQCRSYAQEYTANQYTFNDCGYSDTIYSTLSACSTAEGNYLQIERCAYPSQIPPGLVRRFSELYIDTCCGTCTLDFSELRLYYFPEANFTGCHSNQTSNSTLTHAPKILENECSP